MSRLAPDDAEILRGCLRGDKRAWDGFVDRYSRLIYWSIWKKLETRALPNKKEACRETFQEFFRRALEPSLLQKIAGAENIKRYLHVSVSNLVSERFRRRGTVEKFEVSDESAEAEASEFSDEAVLSERRAILESVLGTLKPDQRKCLELHYLDGHTHQEIANILGLSQDTVSSILRRAKDKLRERLRAKGIED